MGLLLLRCFQPGLRMGGLRLMISATVSLLATLAGGAIALYLVRVEFRP
jgi:hypothetical protein